jgi:hypothetical protein
MSDSTKAVNFLMNEARNNLAFTNKFLRDLPIPDELCQKNHVSKTAARYELDATVLFRRMCWFNLLSLLVLIELRF